MTVDKMRLQRHTVGHDVDRNSQESELEEEIVSRVLPNENGVIWALR